ncbi:MAG TPA: ribosomal protein S18-alanine N-acetyltransferase [Nocardioides sp.]|nr:ribosomal protein S18-alanine N-acetyltransferase [Nocardioides sp.]
MTATIETAAEADVPAIAALEAEALGRDAWPESLVRDGVTGGLPTVHYLVARAGGGLVGYAVVSIVADLAELQRIAVTPLHRRTGVATKLLDHLVGLTVGTEVDRVLLEVREDNEAALRFYAQGGFEEIDRRPRYYRDGATAVVMQRSL